ncbi:hypothetical protein HHL24_14470 [Paraburkholderia sp. RP-4-7]|jgi:hypothetical protein|uniref:Uncharacterized protein n=1 Tax=Paraburkholderia polaris TaxID=2728848 RepID=A0A848ICM8_9BURK|nr:hypothetical protein [Paraburkholderia polaris]
MHAPYEAQYRVIGGSGAGSGGSFTLDAAVVCAAPLAAVSEAPLSAMGAEPADADAAAAVAAGALAAFVAAALVAVFTAGPLAAGAVAAAGMLAPGGLAEKLLGGRGGRDETPVAEVLVALGWRGGSCDSCAMLTLVSRFAVA